MHWGEMGTRWGVNRTVAQIHALLYLSPDPLDAEEISTTLVARQPCGPHSDLWPNEAIKSELSATGAKPPRIPLKESK